MSADRDLRERTFAFSLRVMNLAKTLAKEPSARVIRDQVLRSALSIGANYRESCHSRSVADFISRIKICEGEADETHYWLGLLKKGELVRPERLDALEQEAYELACIFSTISINTQKKNRETKKKPR